MDQISKTLISFLILLITFVIFLIIGDGAYIIGFLICIGLATFFSFGIYKTSIVKERQVVLMKKRLAKIKNMSAEIVECEKYGSDNIPIGILIFVSNDEEYYVQWANASCIEYFKNEIMNLPLVTLSNELDKFVRNNDLSIVIEIYGQTLEVTRNNETLFFCDISKYTELESKYFDGIMTVANITLDNLEASISDLDLQDRSEIISTYISKLVSWADLNDIYLTTNSNERHTSIMTKKQLDILRNDKFSILDDISLISKNRELDVTLSIGICCDDKPITILSQKASDNLKISHNRGGAQVVMNIEDKPTEYYGASVTIVEKRDSIMAKINSKNILSQIEDSDKVLIMTHKTADIDSLGAAIGLLKISLLKNSNTYIIVNKNNIDSTVKKTLDSIRREDMKLSKRIIPSSEALDIITKESLLIMVDHHTKRMTQDVKVIEASKKLIIVDHHRRDENAISDTNLTYIKPEASSSVEIVSEMMRFIKDIEFTSLEASIMLAGIISDTNDFLYSTSSVTFEIASYLRQKGADTIRTKALLKDDLASAQARYSLLSRVELYGEHYAIVIVPDEIILDRVGIAKMADNLLDIDTVHASFVFSNIENNTVSISARSMDNYNVQIIMERMGGGGHFNNAGVQVKNGDILKLKEAVLNILREDIKEKEDVEMEVILVKELKGKGKINDIINVASGYGKYLITSKIAVEATKANRQAIVDQMKEEELKTLALIKEAKKQKEKLKDAVIKVYVRIGGNGKVIGKITTKQISEEIAKQYDMIVDKKRITLDKNIDSLDNHKCTIIFRKEVTVNIIIQVLESK